MKHIVFVLGSFYPRFSAVGVCADRVILALKDEFKISVIAMADDLALEPEISVDGVDVYRVTTPEITKRIEYSLRLKSASSLTNRLRLNAQRARSALRRLVSSVTIDRALVDGYKNRLAAIPDIDVIVPLVFPFESVMAALEYKSLAAVPVVPYLFDNFSDSISLNVFDIARKIKRKRHLALEKMMIERSAVVLSMHQLETHFRAEFGAVVDAKFQFLEHPLLTEAGAVSRPETAFVKLVYTGALIKSVREADYLLELLDGIDFGTRVEADFYVMGNAAAGVTPRVTRFGTVVRNNGQVSKREAGAAVESSSVLLNIGEVEGKQISSKIFEYMSAGKPIVHFAYTADDVVSKILARYPLALSLLQSREQLARNREQFREFVLQSAARTVPFADVASIFPEALPETTAKVIAAVVGACAVSAT